MPRDDNGSNAATNDMISDFMRQYRRQKRTCDEEQGVLRNILKRAKAEGINTKELIASVNDTKLEPDVVAENMQDAVRYRSILGIRTITADKLFDWHDELSVQTSRADDMLEAEERGYVAGRMGVRIEECPYPPGNELHAVWGVNWKRGQAAIARELGPNVKQADASRQRPGRKASQPKLIGTPKTPRRGPPRKRASANGGASPVH